MIDGVDGDIFFHQKIWRVCYAEFLPPFSRVLYANKHPENG